MGSLMIFLRDGILIFFYVLQAFLHDSNHNYYIMFHVLSVCLVLCVNDNDLNSKSPHRDLKISRIAQ